MEMKAGVKVRGFGYLCLVHAEAVTSGKLDLAAIMDMSDHLAEIADLEPLSAMPRSVRPPSVFFSRSRIAPEAHVY
jgi:hypothetical protein